jgi:hypothetical protein
MRPKVATSSDIITVPGQDKRYSTNLQITDITNSDSEQIILQTHYLKKKEKEKHNSSRTHPIDFFHISVLE